MLPEVSGRKCMGSPCYSRAVTTLETPMALGLEPKSRPKGKSSCKTLSLSSQGGVQGRGWG